MTTFIARLNTCRRSLGFYIAQNSDACALCCGKMHSSKPVIESSISSRPSNWACGTRVGSNNELLVSFIDYKDPKQVCDKVHACDLSRLTLVT